MDASHLIYLHGFASGPNSYKAKFLRQDFKQKGKRLIVPNLNQDNFSRLTMTRQLSQLETLVSTLEGQINLIGSSLGGLTATIFAEKHPQISKLILLAPAFNYLKYWLPTFSPIELLKWKMNGYHPIYHFSQRKALPLAYKFIEDFSDYENYPVKRAIPTLIIHGINDEIIPLSASQQYAQDKDWVKLIAMNSDHGLASVLPQICQQLNQFVE